MKRYPHFLSRKKPGTFPTRVVALSADSDRWPIGTDGSVERETLSEWCAAGSLLSSGVPGKQWSGHGTDAKSLWEAVVYGLKRSQSTLCVSYCVSRVWGLIGLWGMIESGELILEKDNVQEATGSLHDLSMPPLRTDTLPQEGERGADTRGILPGLWKANDSARSDMRPRGTTRAAYSSAPILEDPPTIIKVRHKDYHGWLTLVDLRNYGIECYPSELPAISRASWTLGVMLRLIGCLKYADLGGLKHTAGSQALHTFRAKHLTHAIHCHVTEEVLALESAAYIGGRCECLQLGKIPGEVYHLDYRSLYPWVCAAHWVPTCLRAWGKGKPPEEKTGSKYRQSLIACVTIETDEPDYPYRRDGEVIYPVGTFRATLADPELDDAWCRDRIVDWHQWARYDASPALRDYAGNLWETICDAREAGDKPLLQWLKRLAVCLPGKFGQRGNTWVPSPETIPARPWSCWEYVHPDHTTTRYRAIGWTVYREIKEDWSSDAVPSIAAYITSAGRIRLLQAIRAAGRENCYYYDTDSLFCNRKGFDRLYAAGLCGDNELGYLRLMDDEGELEILGIKHYIFRGKRTCAGLPKGHTSPGPFPDTYWYRDWLKRSLLSGQRPHVERILREYARSEVYRHGEVQCDGSVQPLRLGKE